MFPFLYRIKKIDYRLWNKTLLFVCKKAMHLVENQKFFHIPILNKLPSLYKNTYYIWFQTVQSQLWKVSSKQDTKNKS